MAWQVVVHTLDAQARCSAGLLAAVNGVRASHGLAPLHPDSRLDAVAHTQAAYQAATGTMSHVGYAGSTFDRRIASAGLTPSWCSECAAMGDVPKEWVDPETIPFVTPAGAVAGWMSDPPHAAVLLDPHATHCGGGFCDREDDATGELQRYWTIDFAAE